jgi:pimeloyl-ACP methyl ester carboxylesterase
MRLALLFAVAAAATATVAGAAEAVARSHKPRGEMIDIGGRRLRLVCEGPPGARPVVWMESGAFSGGADFAAIQQKLADRGIRSCAYDRAGMGYSDPGPKPRDADAIAQDLERLMAASGEAGPYVLMAHSMGGIYMRAFAGRNPDKVAGLVLIDGMTPETLDLPIASRFQTIVTTIARLNAAAGSVGLTKPFYWMGDRIGLPEAGRAEKRRGFTRGRQARTALAEILQWRPAARQAVESGKLRPEWPVAVISAGQRRSESWSAVREGPARRSQAGFVGSAPDANHTTVLGLTYGDAVVEGLEHVLAHLPARAQ